jgi:putative chitinase
VNITPALLRAATGCTQERAVLFADAMDAGCAAYEINTPLRLAHFLAQVGHESGALAHVREIWGPTAAQQRYEGRADLGNTQPGDGERYCGRGLLQTTGRANYTALRDRLRARGLDAPDFVAAPSLLEHPQWAVLSACDYWGMRNINRLADADDFVGVTKAINGGTNGIEDRRRRLARAVSALGLTDTPQATEPAPLPPKETRMPLPAVLAALLPSLVSAIPTLGKLFGSGSDVAERNVKAAELAMSIAQEAVGAKSAQEAVETAARDPVAAQQIREAVEARWMELSEAGGDGIAGARKADAAVMHSDGPWWVFLRSPSFWMLLLSLPLVYIIVGSIAGLWGHSEWSPDVRASLATAVVSLIVGGAAGYFWGQTTSRNRTPAA